MIVILAFMGKQVYAHYSYNDELMDIASFVEDIDLGIAEWQVTMKEQFSQQKADALLEQLHDEFHVTSETDEQRTQYSVAYELENGKMEIGLHLIYPKNKAYKAELIGVIKGTNWHKKIEEVYVQQAQDMYTTYFTKSSRRFACLTTQDNAIIGNDYFFEKLIEKLDIVQMKTQTDSIKDGLVKKNIYGYTPLWGQLIMTSNEKVNVQIVAKENDSGEVNFVIGTPILINEY